MFRFLVSILTDIPVEGQEKSYAMVGSLKYFFLLYLFVMQKGCIYLKIITLLIFLLVGTALGADQLELINGDRLSGSILSLSETAVRIKTSYGTVDVPRADILRGSFGETASSEGETSVIEAVSTVSQQEDPALSLEMPRKGLVFEFLFHGNLKDTSGNGYKLTPQGQILFTGGFDGQAGAAVLSDGTGTYLALAGNPALDDLESFTFSCWIFIQGEAGSQYLVSKWENTSGQSAKGKFALSYAQGQLSFYIVDKSGTYHGLKLKGELGLKTWHHIAASFGQGKLALYLDAKLLGSRQVGATGLFTSPAPLYLLTAKSFTADTWAFYNLSGRMDNARLYDRILGDEELQLLAYEGAQLF